MVDRLDPADRLREIGRRPTPPLDDDRLAAIEARVLAAVDAPDAAAPATHDGRRRFVVRVAVAAVMVLLAVLGAVALAARDSGEGLVIESAAGVLVDAPDTGVVVAASGDRIQDGSVVAIEPGGSATIDGVAYGPGRYVVADGRLRRDPPDAPPGGAGVVPAPAATTTTTSITTTTSTTSTSTSTTTTLPATTSTSTPTPVRPAATAAPETRPQRTSTTTTTIAATTTVAVRAVPTEPPSRPATTTSAPPPTRPSR
jgi:hypothetical protein